MVSKENEDALDEAYESAPSNKWGVKEMKRFLQIAALSVALAGGGAAQASALGLEPVSSPQLTASDVFVHNDPTFENLFAIGSGATFDGSGSYDFTINIFYESVSGPESGTLDILDGLDFVYQGSLMARGFSDEGIELLFSTDTDSLGIGSRSLVLLNGSFGAGDPFANQFTVEDANATIAAPIPLPPTGILLLAGVGGILLAGWLRKSTA